MTPVDSRRTRNPVPSAVGFFFFGSYIGIIYYLPTYFQSIDGVSAIGSGVHNLPFVLVVSVFTVILAGYGNGLGVQVPMIMAQANTDASDMAATTAILMCFQTIGGAFMQAGAQAAFANRLLHSHSAV
ncbi:hypothetical protein CNMCM5623_004226 [Aspergillus felis]|uniref:Major facilitator superfamily (MFS) profile domain-containing protein n=1 Tax=Aspergillus felis TaxID=1287682 RepID=A0A8H6QHC3_9EURO|nr:hypothetical protein CNMCM5623_004226 [Aspergillus felis]